MLKDPFAKTSTKAVEEAQTETSPRQEQRAKEEAGVFEAAFVLGPNQSFIPTYYSKEENAFLPVAE